MPRLSLVVSICLVLLPSVAFTEVWVTRTLRIGSVVKEGDLKFAGETGENAARSMIGQEARRILYVGQPVSSDDLGPPTLVRRNEIVVMTYRSAGLGIRTEGRALSPGGVGEIVEVMNLSSRLKVRATVTGMRAVEIRR